MANLAQVSANVESQETPVAVTIYQPNGEPYLAPEHLWDTDPQGKPVPKPCTISVIGSEAKRYRQMEMNIQRRNIRAQKPKLDPIDLRRNRIDQAASAVTDFFGWEDGSQIATFSQEYVLKLLSVDHILRQVEAGIHGHADFFSSNSPS